LSWVLLLLGVAAPAAAQRSPAFLLNDGQRGLGGPVVGGSFDLYSAQFQRALAARSGSLRLVDVAGGDLANMDGMRFHGWDQSLVSGSPVSDGYTNDWLLVEDMALAHQSVVPEPEVVILLATGLLALGAVAYFRGMVG
jgi:hypothetical protein